MNSREKPTPCALADTRSLFFPSGPSGPSNSCDGPFSSISRAAAAQWRLANHLRGQHEHTRDVAKGSHVVQVLLLTDDHDLPKEEKKRKINSENARLRDQCRNRDEGILQLVITDSGALRPAT